MAGRKKKSEPITGIGRDPENQLTVQKSRPLYALWRSGLTLAEFKILDTYLARIDSHKPEHRVVVFEKGELEELLGVKKINNSELEKRLKHLMGNVVKIDDPTKTKSYRLVALFEEAVAEQDENGLWEVRMECTQKAMKYFFNVENLGYLRYKLRSVTSIESRYTYIMFVYLESNRFRKSWEVSLDELKQILNCENEEFYKEFKYFNRDILKRVQKEMHEKTELCFTYEPIKKGRSVVAIRFALETLKYLEPEPDDPNQYTIEDWQNDVEQEKRKKRNEICLGFDSSVFDEFTDKQLEALKELAWRKADPHDIESHKQLVGSMSDAIQYAVTNYLSRQIKIAKTRNPMHLFLYVKKMVETDKDRS